MADINSTLEQRGKTHGRYEDHAQYTQEIKEIIRKSVSYSKLSQDQRETLEMIAHKLGRILAGNPDFFDHWHDIAGYATLSAKLCSDAPGAVEEKKEESVLLPRYEIVPGNALGGFRIKDNVTNKTGLFGYNFETASQIVKEWNERGR